MTPRHSGLIAAGLVLGAVLAWLALAPDPAAGSRAVAKGGSRTADPRGAASRMDLESGLLHTAEKTGEPAASSPLDRDFIDRIVSKDEKNATIPVPGGTPVKGEVIKLARDAQGIRSVTGRITEPEAGRFMFQRQTVPGKAGSMVGFVLFDRSETAWQVRPIGENGGPVLVKTTANRIICRAYPPAAAPEEIPQTHPTNLPIPASENGIIQLQSLPGATAVVYLDFDGEERVFDSWGYINAQPANVTPNQIFDVWRGVCEDYLPFHINITTVRSVYDNAPEGSRIHVIVTPTTDASPGAGGVAYVGSFNWSGEMVCWSFLSTGKNAVEVISHEVGHTLGLLHDGRQPSEAYYAGHTGWAPIMGVGYYQNPSQWSRGEYPNANNPEDDIETIATANNSVSTRPDDHGASPSTASWLEVQSGGTFTNEGVIETRADEDAFRFSTSGGNLTLLAQKATFNANLDIKAEVLDATGTVIATSDPQDSLDATFSAFALAAGDYTLRISGTGKGDLATGYSDYGSLGAYTLAGSLAGATTADRFSIAENVPQGALVGSVVPRVNHGAGTLSFTVASGGSAGPFTLDPATGAITVDQASALDFEALSTRWDDPAAFEWLVEITDSLGTATETLRVVVTVADVNEAPVFPSPAALTAPENLSVGTVLTTLTAIDPDRGDRVNWSIVSGNASGTFAVHPTSGVLSVAGALDFETQPSHLLTLRATDTLTPARSVEAVLSITLIDIAENLSPGSVIRTFFNGIPGATLAALQSNSRFPGKPHSEAVLTSFSGSGPRGDAYGSTVRGYLIAPTAGNYTFWISCDDAGELRLSPDMNPANATVIASQTARSDPDDWTAYPSQQSATITLAAGQVCYIEARHKEDAEADHVSVAWRPPGAAAPEVIPGRWLAPFIQDYAPWAPDASLTVRQHAANGQRIGQPAFTEPDIGQGIFGYSITSGNTAGLFAVNSFNGQITVANSAGLIPGSIHTLTLSAVDNGSPQLTGTATVVIEVLGLHERLHAWWPLDETSGTLAADASGNARNADLTGGGSWITRAPANPCLQLNGTNARLDHNGNNALSGDTPFTLAAWVRVPATHSADAVLIQQQESGSTGHIGRHIVHVRGDGRVRFGVYGKEAGGTNEAYQFDITSTASIDDGNWHHVACVRDGTTGRIFIDGVQSATASGAIRMLDPSLTVAIGCDARNNNAFLNAAVDDVRIYPDALGAAQIQRVAGTPKIAITSPSAASAAIPEGVGLLLAAAASDPDGPAPAISWSLVSGPGAVTFQSTPSGETAASFSLPGTHILRATASDGTNTATDEIAVTAGSSVTSSFGGLTYGSGPAGIHFESPAGTYHLYGMSSGILPGSTSDGFHMVGQVFAGDFDVRARVVELTDVAGTTSERAGLVLRVGSTAHAGAIGGFIGYGSGATAHWIRRASNGGSNTANTYSPSGTPSWCRITRSSGVVQYFHSSDGSNWSLRGISILNGEVRAGLCWSSGNASSVGTATFDQVSGFSTVNTGPLVATGSAGPAHVNLPSSLVGAVSDDALPAPPAAVALQWSLVQGPGPVIFSHPTLAETTVTCSAAGTHTLRLTADDGAIRTFSDLSLTATLLDIAGVAATDATAAETGPDPGTFTFTRGGSLVGDLTVAYTLTGSAANGSDYSTLPGEIVIPAGMTSATLTVSPIADGLVEGTEDVQLTLLPGIYQIDAPSGLILIADSNHAPQWSAPTLNGPDADEGVLYAAPGFLAAASDPDGDLLTFSKSGGPAWLEIASDGSVTGTPGPDDAGMNTFRVRASDGSLHAEADFKVFVHFANLPPFFTANPLGAADAMAALPYSAALPPGSAGDPNTIQGDTLTFSKTAGPAWLEVNPDGSLHGTPGAADEGTCEFTLRVTDSGGYFAETVLRVVVAPTRLHLDANGADPGSGAPAALAWDNSAIWTPDAAGGIATMPWIPGARAVFSAGTDSTTTSITVDGTRILSGLTLKDGGLILEGGQLDLSGTSATFDITGSATFGSALSGTGTELVKTGSGTLALTGSQPFAGSLRIASGTLDLQGTLPAAASLTVDATATLSGSGSTLAPVSLSGTVDPAGNTTASLTTGPLSLAGDATLLWNFTTWNGEPGIGHDTVFASSLDLTHVQTLTLRLPVPGPESPPAPPAAFTLIRTTGGITGFDAGKILIDVSSLTSSGGSWSVRTSGGDLVLDYTPPPFEVWKNARFGAQASEPLVSGASADPDADSLPNLLEYACGTDPNTANPPPASMDLTGGWLRLHIPRDPLATDVTLIVETTSDLTDSGSWTTTGTVVEESTPSLLVVRDALGGPHRFIRVKARR